MMIDVVVHRNVKSEASGEVQCLESEIVRSTPCSWLARTQICEWMIKLLEYIKWRNADFSCAHKAEKKKAVVCHD